MRGSLMLFILMCAVPWIAVAEDANNWANWRGPNYNGSVDGASPPLEWSADENIKWKTAVPGKGSASPIVWGDFVYLLTAIETSKAGEPSTAQPAATGGPAAGQGQQGRRRGGPGRGRRGGRSGMNNPMPTNIYEFAVLAYDRNTGKEAWRTVVNEAVPHEGGHKTNTFASGSVVTDGQHIFAFFGSYGIYCLAMSGEQVWERDLGTMQTRNSFGEGGSPALHGDTLIVPWDQDGFEDRNGNGTKDPGELLSFVMALDAKTGDTRWKVARPDEPTTWATPLIVETDGRSQAIVHGTTVRSYDMKDGKLLWECGGQVTNPIPCPVRFGDSVVCMTGYRGNAIYAMSLDGTGDIYGTDQVRWSRSDAGPYVSSPTLYKGQLYFTKGLSSVMSSVDATTGKVIIGPTRLSDIRNIYASPIAAGDRIYFTGREGVTTVIRHGDKFEELAVNRLGEPVDASPAVSGDQIFIRGAQHLFCISE